jgi:quercetin dioxygenase-like cupin family protein
MSAREGHPINAAVVSAESVASFRPERFTPVPVAGNERARVLVVCFEPGQFIPVHRPGVDLTLIVLEGEGLLVAGTRDESVRRGSVAFVPAGESRGLQATTRLIAVTVVTPPPTDADHVEVMARLQRGEFR